MQVTNSVSCERVQVIIWGTVHHDDTPARTARWFYNVTPASRGRIQRLTHQRGIRTTAVISSTDIGIFIRREAPLSQLELDIIQLQGMAARAEAQTVGDLIDDPDEDYCCPNEGAPLDYVYPTDEHAGLAFYRCPVCRYVFTRPGRPGDVAPDEYDPREDPDELDWRNEAAHRTPDPSDPPTQEQLYELTHPADPDLYAHPRECNCPACDGSGDDPQDFVETAEDWDELTIEQQADITASALGYDDEPTLYACPMCQSAEAICLGQLGNLIHLRCRDCGANYHHPVEA